MDVVESGLYIVFQWIELRRQEAKRLLHQYNINMLKTFNMIMRRMSIMRGESYAGVPNAYRRMLFGVPGTTRSGRWFLAPDHERVRRLFNGWVQRLYAYQILRDNPDGQGSPITVYRPYFLPGM